jgi:hypothetical protein
VSVTLDVLPAAHGDALVVTYGAAPHRHRIVVDGGPVGTYATGLQAYLERLPADERHIELLIVSHIDTDHIDGALVLLQDEALGLTIDDVWFNGWAQVNEGSRGGLQGAFLDDLLVEHHPNRAFGEGAARRDLEHPVTLEGGARLTVLSPTPIELDRLRTDWAATVTKAGFTPGDGSAVAQRLRAKGRYDPPTDDGEPVARGESKLGTDRAPANGSSIAVLLEVEGRRLLLGADAHAAVLHGALTALAQRDGTSSVAFDLVKLPHHGSAGNLTPELMRLIDCAHFVVSTNGDHFNHPDQEAIELLGHPEAPPLVSFNYRSDSTVRWADEAEQARIGIRSQYGQDGFLSLDV